MSGWARRTGTTLLAGLVAATALTGAYARWGGRATGTGTVLSGTARTVDLGPGTISGGLYPGGSARVTLVATNPNPGPVQVVRLSLDATRGTGGLSVDAAHVTCSTGGITFAASDNQGLGWTIPGSSSLAITLPRALTADLTLADACQGATLTVFLTAS